MELVQRKYWKRLKNDVHLQTKSLLYDMASFLIMNGNNNKK